MSLLAIGLIAAVGCSAETEATDGQNAAITAIQPSMPAFQPAGAGPLQQPWMQQPGIQQPPVNDPVPDPNVGNPVPDPNVNNPVPDPNVGNPVPDPNVNNPVPDPIMDPMAGMGAPDPIMMPPTPTTGSKDPTIPAVSAQCPTFRSGTISFMGLSGIQISAGAKPASATAPMVFYWHGTGSNAGEFALMATAVNSGVTSEGGVLVSFNGTTGGDLLSGTAIFGEGDFNLADQLVACAVENHNVDPRQIFATGCSAGGLFSGAMAAMRSNYIAAAAPNSGGWVLPARFQNDYTPALMTIHGAPGVDVVVIDFSNASKTADDGFKARGGFVINCNHGGGHCGGGGLAPDIWKFFKAHPYGVDPHPWTSLPPGFNSACKIY